MTLTFPTIFGSSWLLPLGLLFVSAVGTLTYFGLFKKIIWKSKQSDEDVVLVVRFVQGPFQHVPKTLKEVLEELNKADIPTLQACGIYLDDPNKVPETYLRHLLGFILPASEVPKTLPENLHILPLPLKSHTLQHTTFPFRRVNRPLSVMIGVLKIYSSLSQLLKSNQIQGGPMLEIYDVQKGLIEYFVLNEQVGQCLDKFYGMGSKPPTNADTSSNETDKKKDE